jgi:hypothetical protein
MKILYTILFCLCCCLSSQEIQAHEISKPSTFGIGLAYSYPAYGLSARYNFTDTHTGQIILGTASYGFGANSFAASGRYVYNFKQGDSSFIFRPYAYGQAGYNSVNFTSVSYTTVSFGVGGGIEYTFNNFIDNLYFTTELGYVNGSFDSFVGGFSGFAWGWGIHYRFDI